ncbi:acyltransferase family protein [Longimicrobium sp.]|uniref:acyltransferase family protein n=1 Tax=Longimicrobium sp. TaxID=2029185 RepID=UPI002BDB8C89|nr:heparan-alpha-glucosaminide N-acetyltransferase domain-containing protein [Longimicrobium sp.]HSU14069.1 heparan-alpha-glucosaminide N-acetyltransferase domain-containing protein [Longimicrobium sp.]
MTDTLAASPSSSPTIPAVEIAGGPADADAKPGRLLALDVFRGITIAGMLLVNNPGSWDHVYEPLDHAPWNGWTPTDTIFPFFLFIVGVAMTMSFAGQMARGQTRARVFVKSTRRSATLFGLGLLLAAFPYYNLDPGHLRVMGVLQRIAVCFLLASAVYLYAPKRARPWVAAALLLGYWAAMTLVPVPAFGAGDLVHKDGSLAAYVDRMVIGTNHLWAAAKTWDPEGLLSTLPAVATVLLGIFAGEWIRGERAPAERATGLFFAGNALMAAGLVWNAVFPINKNLWTSSYVLFMGGMAMVGLAMCYWVVDVKGVRRWTRPFVVFGTNAIAAFFLSGVFARLLNLVKVPGGAEGTQPVKAWIYANLFASWIDPLNASLAFALVFVAVWWAIMEIFYRKKIFIKV